MYVCSCLPSASKAYKVVLYRFYAKPYQNWCVFFPSSSSFFGFFVCTPKDRHCGCDMSLCLCVNSLNPLQNLYTYLLTEKNCSIWFSESGGNEINMKIKIDVSNETKRTEMGKPMTKIDIDLIDEFDFPHSLFRWIFEYGHFPLSFSSILPSTRTKLLTSIFSSGGSGDSFCCSFSVSSCFFSSSSCSRDVSSWYSAMYIGGGSCRFANFAFSASILRLVTQMTDSMFRSSSASGSIIIRSLLSNDIDDTDDIFSQLYISARVGGAR